MTKVKTPLPIDCGLHLTNEVLKGRWKLALITAVSFNLKQPGEILTMLPGATLMEINDQLNELEKHGIIEKDMPPDSLPEVEYSLTFLGRSIIPIIDELNAWGSKNRRFLETVVTSPHAFPGSAS